MMHILQDVALVAVIGFAVYALAVLMVVVTGPHNECEKRERNRHGH